jgi:hypothetical protein
MMLNVLCKKYIFVLKKEKKKRDLHVMVYGRSSIPCSVELKLFYVLGY